MRERESLIARIRGLHRAALAAGAPPSATGRDPDPPRGVDDADADRLVGLEQRIALLEQMVEGLQDSVHRESERQGKRIADLEAQIQPAALSAALTKDARERGL